MHDNWPVYVISVAAELTGVHPQTLRVYESRGLVRPQRTKGGTRRYSRADLERIGRIHELTRAGLNLAGVGIVLQLEDSLNRLQRQLEADTHTTRGGDGPGL
jgi:MerR family transcriptional regulator/heat shock protein HspR